VGGWALLLKRSFKTLQPPEDVPDLCEHVNFLKLLIVAVRVDESLRGSADHQGGKADVTGARSSVHLL
jgi:hypothetical protein